MSVSTSDPPKVPASVGAKLIGNWHEAPAASVPGNDAVEATSGQAVPAVLFRVKFSAMLGLLPEPGTGKASAALPMFESVTVCGLSVLMDPTLVGAKVNAGGAATVIMDSTPVPCER